MKYNIDAKDEFTLLIKRFIAPLLGISYSTISLTKEVNNSGKLVELKNKHLYFYENIKTDNCYKIMVSDNFPKESLSLLKNVYQGLLKVRYKSINNQIYNEYDSLEHLLKNYEYTLQKELLKWFSEKCLYKLLKLIDVLEQWKMRTYEGKKVPFAFVIDESSNDGAFDFMDFLEEEYSATFSDGITSVIELDSNMKFRNYLSVTNTKINVDHSYANTPFRFSEVIETFTDNKLGVFLLTNGDIVLVKNKDIKLVKREGKWLNFNKSVFKSIISSELKQSSENFLVLLDQIYLTALDVSFSHAGGIIAGVSNDKINNLIEPNEFKSISVKSELSQKAILNYVDNLQFELPTYNKLVLDYPKIFDNNQMKKRFLKRDFLKLLIRKNKFTELDRKLRSELISMDGATIINYDGDIVAVGAIIQNDSGSYGGGRGAAAKKLSNYGFAIKISTDGYIEVYINDRIKFKIK